MRISCKSWVFLQVWFGITFCCIGVGTVLFLHRVLLSREWGVPVFLVGGRAKGGIGELVGPPRWELVLTGSGIMHSTKDLTQVSTRCWLNQGS